MALLSSKNGFRGEYLARYIVSRFAFISESSVGEDYGIDFYCGLSKEIINENNEHQAVTSYIKYWGLGVYTNLSAPHQLL